MRATFAIGNIGKWYRTRSSASWRLPEMLAITIPAASQDLRELLGHGLRLHPTGGGFVSQKAKPHGCLPLIPRLGAESGDLATVAVAHGRPQNVLVRSLASDGGMCIQCPHHWSQDSHCSCSGERWGVARGRSPTLPRRPIPGLPRLAEPRSQAAAAGLQEVAARIPRGQPVG
jgi:hypothetical protein